MPSDIFKMLNSIPIILNTQDIFNYEDKSQSYFVLKGMFSYQFGHYLAFFRRLGIKLNQLAKSEKEIEQMFREVKVNEWTMFDDGVIQAKKNWVDVVK